MFLDGRVGAHGLDGLLQQGPEVVAVRQDLLNAMSCLDELVPDLLGIRQDGFHLGYRLPRHVLDLVGVREGFLHLASGLGRGLASSLAGPGRGWLVREVLELLAGGFGLHVRCPFRRSLDGAFSCPAWG